MPVDVTSLKIRALIVHEVPKKPLGGGSVQPILSEIEIHPDDDVKLYFRKKVAETLARVAFCARFDPATTSPAPGLIRDALGPKTTSFVDMSQAMAHHLSTCQNAINPAGLLTVIEGTLSGQPAIVIAKLEKETGVRLNQTKVNGKLTFNPLQIRDLMLSDETRIFKVGLFRRSSPTSPITGDVSDTQTGYQPTRPMATFFLKQFLGCDYCDEPDKVTQTFFVASEKFIADVADPLLKAGYEMALLSELNSSNQTVNPRAFAARHLRPEDQDAFIATIQEQHVPATPFAKDLSRIHSHLQRVKYDFAAGVSVVGSPQALEQTTALEGLPDGRSRLTITDELRQTKGHR